MHIHQLINKGTIEEYMIQLQHTKHAKAMEFIGKKSEKMFAGLQRDMYNNKSGGKFTLKGAVLHLLDVRKEIENKSNISRISEKMRLGFRDPNVYTLNVDKEIDKLAGNPRQPPRQPPPQPPRQPPPQRPSLKKRKTNTVSRPTNDFIVISNDDNSLQKNASLQKNDSLQKNNSFLSGLRSSLMSLF